MQQQAPRLYHLVRLWIELARGLNRGITPDMQAKFGSRTGYLLIAAAVYIGTIEGRPMTAAKIAAFIGMPRPTVIRRLSDLCDHGVVERVRSTYRTPQKRVERTRRRSHAALVRLVRAACEELSK